MNISSALVQTRPEWVDDVLKSLEGVPGVDVHFWEKNGRIIITIEGEDVDEEVDRVNFINQTSHVVSVDMINHYFGEGEG